MHAHLLNLKMLHQPSCTPLELENATPALTSLISEPFSKDTLSHLTLRPLGTSWGCSLGLFTSVIISWLLHSAYTQGSLNHKMDIGDYTYVLFTITILHGITTSFQVLSMICKSSFTILYTAHTSETGVAGTTLMRWKVYQHNQNACGCNTELTVTTDFPHNYIV